MSEDIIILSSDESDPEINPPSELMMPLENIKIKEEKSADALPGFMQKLHDALDRFEVENKALKLSKPPSSSQKSNSSKKDDKVKNTLESNMSNIPGCSKNTTDVKPNLEVKNKVHKSTKLSKSSHDHDWLPNNHHKKKNEYASMKSPPIYNFDNKPNRRSQLKNPSRGQKSAKLNLATKFESANDELISAKYEEGNVTPSSTTSSYSKLVEYEVEKILDHEEIGPERFLYRVKWKGFDESACTWEPLENLTHCIQRVHQYKLKSSRPSNPVEQRFQQLKHYLSQHTDEMLDILVQRFCNDRGELNIPKVDLSEINGYIRNFARHPHLIKTNKAELDYLRTQLLTSVLYEKRLAQLETLKRYEMEINVTTGNTVAPIYVINNVDLTVVPSNFTHTNLNIPTEGVFVDEEPIIWCECADNCQGSTHCCGQLNDSVSAYDSNKRLVISQGTPIYECNKKCRCDDSCPNRVIQLGTQVRLAIYKTYNGCGWGVQTLEFIPRGTYVTEYVGEILTYEAASRRENQTYLFNLDFNGSTAYVIDACNYGSVSHFINHSCEPNLAVFPAYIQCVDPNLHRLPLFAIKDIEKGQQLSFSYYKSVNKTRSRKIKCKCESAACRGFLSVEGSSL